MAANKYFEYLKQQKESDYPDPCYSLVPDIVKMYAKVPPEELTVQDLTVLYMMTIYSDPGAMGRSQVYYKIKDVQESHLDKKDKDKIISRLEKHAAIEDDKHVGLFAIAKQVIGDEKTYPNNKDAAEFIGLCFDISRRNDEDLIIRLANHTLPRLQLPGVGMGIVSQILHCLNPRVFPVLNSPGVQNYAEHLGLKLSKKTGFETYLENIEIIRKYRDENFSFKNYRIIDTMGWEIEEWEKKQKAKSGAKSASTSRSKSGKKTGSTSGSKSESKTEPEETKSIAEDEKAENSDSKKNLQTSSTHQRIWFLGMHERDLLKTFRMNHMGIEFFLNTKTSIEKGDIIVYWLRVGTEGIAGWGEVQSVSNPIGTRIGNSKKGMSKGNFTISRTTYTDTFDSNFPVSTVSMMNDVLLDRYVIQTEIERLGYIKNLKKHKARFVTEDGVIQLYQFSDNKISSFSNFIREKTGINFPGSDPISRPAAQSQTVNPMADKPTSIDQLGRQPFAGAIADKLQIIWEDNRDSESDAPVMVHLHGPWGSGKSSMINFITENLKNREKPWQVVEFNAWQNQHIDPPWWSLYSEILHHGFGDSYRRWIKFSSYAHRLVSGKGPHIIAMIVLSLVVYVVLKEKNYYEAELKLNLPGLVQLVNHTFTFLGALFGLFLAFSKHLFHGSAKTVSQYIDEAHTPMSAIRKKFRDLMAKAKNPILVVIDDMDRCHTEYTVKLLEGIQTLFASKNVAYLVVADRRWLYSCYESVYDKFTDNIKEPGKQLGAHFLEKAFEFSFPVPGITDEMRKSYWQNLIGVLEEGGRLDLKEQESKIEKHKEAIRQKLQDVQNEEVIFQNTKEPQESEDDESSEERFYKAQARRAVQVEMLSKRKIQESIEHFLLQFWPLVEPNPRAMKRLLNAYTIQASLAVLAGLELEDQNQRKQLVLFTIVALRWPSLERELATKPQVAGTILEAAKKGDKIPTALEKKISLEEQEIQTLITDPEVQKVFSGQGVEVQLDARAVELFQSLQNEGKVESSVA